MIQQLMKFETAMLKKYEERGYENDTQFKKDIIKFLENLEAREKFIKTNKEFAWALAAISRWTHYLSMRFDFFLSIKSPDLRKLRIYPEYMKKELESSIGDIATNHFVYNVSSLVAKGRLCGEIVRDFYRRYGF